MNLKIFFFLGELQKIKLAALQCSISVRTKPYVAETEIDNASALIAKLPSSCACVSQYMLIYIDMCMIYLQLQKGLIMTPMEIKRRREQSLSV